MGNEESPIYSANRSFFISPTFRDSHRQLTDPSLGNQNLTANLQNLKNTVLHRDQFLIDPYTEYS